MKLLGIDYGERKVGIAVSEGVIAEPFRVIRGVGRDELLRKVSAVVRSESPGKLIVGISEGKTANDAKNFGDDLRKTFGIDVEYEDETLTTLSAQELSINANIKRKKRKAMEDAYSAALILQKYLDREF